MNLLILKYAQGVFYYLFYIKYLKLQKIIHNAPVAGRGKILKGKNKVELCCPPRVSETYKKHVRITHILIFKNSI